MREYVSVSANGTVAETDDEIILSFYGPGVAAGPARASASRPPESCATI